MDPRIADFIAKNQGKYTREAIRQQLIEAGHDPADIDATWAVLDTPDPDEASVAGEGFWPRFFMFLIGLNLAVFLIVALTTGMVSQGIGLAGVFAVALGIGALLAWGIVAAVGPAKLGRTTALVIGGVIPIFFALLIGGSCFALASAIGPPPLPLINGEMEVQIDGPFPLDEAGVATCQPYRDASSFSVYSNDLGQIEGNPVYVSVDAYDIEPGNQNINVSIAAEGSATGQYWSNNADSQLQADIAADGLSGTLTFTALFPAEGELGPDANTLSGTISWNCEAP